MLLEEETSEPVPSFLEGKNSATSTHLPGRQDGMRSKVGCEIHCGKTSFIQSNIHDAARKATQEMQQHKEEGLT